VRQWALEVPEVVNISVNTPYPGTETWLTEARRLESRDYRLFDIQHSVLPTRLPLEEFYRELVATQQVLNTKHLGWSVFKDAAGIVLKLLLRGQTNFAKSIWKFSSVFNADLLLADHRKPVAYEIPMPPAADQRAKGKTLYILKPRGRAARATDAATEQFVDETRMGSSI
jgi:hypothetical protein